MDEDTLEGKRRDVYALLKIFKYAMDSEAKSYDAKYAVEMTFGFKDPSDIFGKALKEEVLMHKSIRGLLNGSKVHADLKKLGITEIKLNDNDVDFRGILSNFFIGWIIDMIFYIDGKDMSNDSVEENSEDPMLLEDTKDEEGILCNS